MGSYDILPPEDEIVNAYFHWLCEMVHADDPQESYINLMVVLFQTEYIWTIDNDVNRAEDGKHLRQSFFDDPDILNRPCTVLEMMIALAIRIDDEVMWNPDKGNRTAIWFWEMIDNLGLGELDDGLNYSKIERIASRKLHIFMYRMYKNDGVGSLFPMKNFDLNLSHVTKNSNTTEVWYQMMLYMVNKYGVEDE